MCRKLTCSICFVLLFGFLLPSAAPAADPDLIGWWKLNEGSGDVAIDSSRSATNGRIVNAATGGLGPGGSVWVNDPERGMVISFNGTDGSGACVVTDLTVPAMTLTNDFTWAFWAKQHPNQATNNDTMLGNRYNGVTTAEPWQFIKFTPTRFEFFNDDRAYAQGINYNSIPNGVWIHHVIVKDGNRLTYYRNGIETGTNTITKTVIANPFYMGADAFSGVVEAWQGYMSDVRLYTKALSLAELMGAMQGSGEPWPYASSPSPADGALHKDTWVNLSWQPGAHAVSHDVYLGDNLDQVKDATKESETFRGNQTGPYYVAGFPGYAYPNGLVPGTTYYWRIDEVNDADPNSPWKGEIWRFSIPPRTAYNPIPADGAEGVAADAKLSWTAGHGARLHTVYFGDDFGTVANAAGGPPQGTTTYNPGPLKLEEVYYWRVDEFDGVATHIGNVWTFTTVGAVGKPYPAHRGTDVQLNAILTWTAATSAASHQLYFGTDMDAVRAADAASPQYKGSKALGAESYDPGLLEPDTAYYWRVDEVDGQGNTSIGPLWSFTTGRFLLVDDFESYNDIDPPDPASNRIFDVWIDGFASQTTNGALVGNELPPYAERTIVHGGAQSMPYSYDNNGRTSEATKTLVQPRDWTQAGVTKLSLWFAGERANAAERMYVALNGSAVVYHDNQNVAQTNNWTRWVIDLQAFQGVNLTNVNTITIGFGTKNSPAAGGSGKMYFDDIRLYQP